MFAQVKQMTGGRVPALPGSWRPTHSLSSHTSVPVVPRRTQSPSIATSSSGGAAPPTAPAQGGSAPSSAPAQGATQQHEPLAASSEPEYVGVSGAGSVAAPAAAHALASQPRESHTGQPSTWDRRYAEVRMRTAILKTLFAVVVSLHFVRSTDFA